MRFSLFQSLPRRWLILSLLFPSLLLCLHPPAYGAADTTLRPFSVEDVLQLEDLGESFGGPFSFSVDGTLAFTRVRSIRTVTDVRWEWLHGNAGGDIWLQSGQNPPVNLTQGDLDGSGWWAPEWSPDGRYLAMLSTRGGTVRIWLWDTGTSALELLVDAAVSARGSARPFEWLDSRTLLFLARTEGSSSADKQVGLTTPERLTDAWSSMPTGRKVTASVLNTGINNRLAFQPDSRLIRVDIPSREPATIARADAVAMAVAPDKHIIALLERAPGPPPEIGRKLSFDYERLTLKLLSVDGTPIELAGSLAAEVTEASLHWSPDANALAVQAQHAVDGRLIPALYVVDIPSKRLHPTSLPSTTSGNEDATSLHHLQWTGEGSLLARVQSTADGQTPASDWWVFKRDGQPRKLADFTGGAPTELWPRPGHNVFFGLLDDALVEVDLDGVIHIARSDHDVAFKSLEWPVSGQGDVLDPDVTAGFDQLLLIEVQGSDTRLAHLDLVNGVTHPLSIPDTDARLVAYDPASRSVLLKRSDAEGLNLWRTWLDHVQSLTLVNANQHLREIQPVSAKRIDYVGLHGAPLHAWLLLPANIDEHEQLPLLTSVYPGSSTSNKLPWSARLDSNTPINLNIPLGRGYAILIPDMPIDTDTEPMAGLANGVLPAIDKVLADYPIDPHRLYLIGHSYGGYATLGLVTQTSRFSAAVSLAGLSNLISMHGQLGARQRYEDQLSPQALFGMYWTEVGQGQMKKPFWEDPDRYLRNSPVFQAGQVQTPVLMIHGDLDAVPMQQAEEFFTALYRSGKQARFVRYWGEGHILKSPANIHDMWEQIFTWLDYFPPARSEDSSIID